MKTKQIILLVIIIVAVAVAGVFFYKTFSKNIQTEALQAQTDAVAASSGSKILPHGDQLDFDTVRKFNPNKQFNQYPAVTSDEAKSQLNSIISQ